MLNNKKAFFPIFFPHTLWKQMNAHDQATSTNNISNGGGPKEFKCNTPNKEGVWEREGEGGKEEREERSLTSLSSSYLFYASKTISHFFFFNFFFNIII